MTLCITACQGCSVLSPRFRGNIGIRAGRKQSTLATNSFCTYGYACEVECGEAGGRSSAALLVFLELLIFIMA